MAKCQFCGKEFTPLKGGNSLTMGAACIAKNGITFLNLIDSTGSGELRDNTPLQDLRKIIHEYNQNTLKSYEFSFNDLNINLFNVLDCIFKYTFNSKLTFKFGGSEDLKEAFALIFNTDANNVEIRRNKTNRFYLTITIKRFDTAKKVV